MPITYDFSNLNHLLSSLITPPLTIQKLEWETRDWGQVLKITFAENLNYGSSIFNTMHFLRYAEDADGQHSLEVEAFFYFVNKLNQPVQIPIHRTLLDEQDYIYWVLSDEVMKEIKAEKNKWNNLGYDEFADWYQENKSAIEQEVRKKINWIDIHPDFAKKPPRSDKTYQQNWEDQGLTYQDAREWIPAGFEPNDYYSIKQWKDQGCELSIAEPWAETGIKSYWEVKQWKDHDFAPREAKSWIDAGLKKDDYKFAAYLKEKNYTPATAFREKSYVQRYLDCFYPRERRGTIKELRLYNKNLTGSLDLNDFVNLEDLDCSDNQLTSLNLSNCLKLKKLDCRNNNFSKQDLSLFGHLVNLKELKLGSNNQEKVNQDIYNRFYGSLELLQSLTKLNYLDISNTDISEGLEYLPENINCSIKERNSSKVRAIAEQLELSSLFFDLKNGKYARDWTNIHSGFTKKTWWNDKKTYQQYWEGMDIVYSEARQWIRAGFELHDYDKVGKWKKAGFTCEETKQWIELGFSPNESYEVRQWKKNGFNYEEFKKWFAIGFAARSYKVAEEWKKLGLNFEQIKQLIKSNFFRPSDCYYAREWIEAGFTMEEIKKLVEAGFQKDDCGKAERWKEQNFSIFQILEWINVGLRTNESDFASHLKKRGCQPNTPDIKEMIIKDSWQDIHKYFKHWWRKKWEERGFDYEQTKKWIRVLGTEFGINDYDYCVWLRDIKKINTEWTLNDEQKQKLREEYGEPKLDVEVIRQIEKFKHNELIPEQQSLVDQLILNSELRERYRKYGLCKECQQPKSGQNWCQSCDAQHFAQDFPSWTSGNRVVDEFIQKQQLKATNNDDILEWMSYKRFADIEYLAEGGFGKVYKAKWTNKYIKSWNAKNNKWQRYEDESKGDIVLKSLHNSRDITADFLREVAYHTVTDNGWIVKCYGISQDPKTKNYLMVMRYIGDNMRQYLQKNYSKINFSGKMNQLKDIARGLNSIHEQGLVHRDFHAGNILNNTNSYLSKFHIADLGLCRPANETSEEKIYGVLPYVAPEVLRGEPYTQKADIYSWGIVACEMFSGLPPYHNIVHGRDLAEKICRGLRPNLSEVKAPQLLKDLISRCLDAEPANRPTADELSRTLDGSDIGVNKKDMEFYRQYKEMMDAGGFKQPSSLTASKLTYKTHSQAIYTSRLLDFKKLPKSQNNPSQEWQASALLELQIKGIESEINLFKKQKGDEVAKLIDNLVQVRKKMLENESNEVKKEIQELEKALEKRGFLTENMDEIIRYCEKLVDLEQQKEKEQKETTGLTASFKRQLSLESQTKTSQGETKLPKIIEEQKNYPQMEYYAEPMETNSLGKTASSTGITEDLNQLYLSTEDLTNVQFSQVLIQSWQARGFTYQQVQEWIQVGLQLAEVNFASWLRDVASRDIENFAEPQWIKEKIATGELNLNELRQVYHQEEINNTQQAQIVHQPWTNN